MNKGILRSIKKLFCKKHEWVKVEYHEGLDDTGRVVYRTTIYQCEKCGKRHEYNHKMPADYGIPPYYERKGLNHG